MGIFRNAAEVVELPLDLATPEPLSLVNPQGKVGDLIAGWLGAFLGGRAARFRGKPDHGKMRHAPTSS